VTSRKEREKGRKKKKIRQGKTYSMKVNIDVSIRQERRKKKGRMTGGTRGMSSDRNRRTRLAMLVKQLRENK